MPNWCSNKLILITPDKFKIAEVLDYIKVEKGSSEQSKFGIGTFDFGKVVPEPQYENSDVWYWWRVQHWGTKWNTSDCAFIDSENSLIFETAWAPPEPVIKTLAAKFPEVHFVLKYAEPGMGFAGKNEYEGGELVFEGHYSIEYDDEAVDLTEELLGPGIFDYVKEEVDSHDGRDHVTIKAA